MGSADDVMLLSKESRIWGPAFLSVQGANPEGELSREGMLFWRFYVCVCVYMGEMGLARGAGEYCSVKL